MNGTEVSQQAREAANNWIRTAPLAVKMAVVNPTLLYEAFARFEQAIRSQRNDGADGRVQELNKISGAQP